MVNDVLVIRISNGELLYSEGKPTDTDDIIQRELVPLEAIFVLLWFANNSKSLVSVEPIVTLKIEPIPTSQIGDVD
jgi:hypothetical protein